MAKINEIELKKYEAYIAKALTDERKKSRIIKNISRKTNGKDILKRLVENNPSLIANVSSKSLTGDLLNLALSKYGINSTDLTKVKSFFTMLPIELKINDLVVKTLLNIDPSLYSFMKEEYRTQLGSDFVADKKDMFKYIPEDFRTKKVLKTALQGKYAFESFSELSNKYKKQYKNIQMIVNNSKADWKDVDTMRKYFLNGVNNRSIKKFIPTLINKNPRLLFKIEKNDTGNIISRNSILQNPNTPKSQEIILNAFNKSLKEDSHVDFVKEMPRKSFVSSQTLLKMIESCGENKILDVIENIKLEEHKHLKINEVSEIIETALIYNNEVFSRVNKILLTKCLNNRLSGSKLLSLALYQNPLNIEYASKPINKRQAFILVHSCISQMNNPNKSKKDIKKLEQIFSRIMGIDVIKNPDANLDSKLEDIFKDKFSKRQLRKTFKVLMRNDPEFLAKCSINEDIAKMRSYKNMIEKAQEESPKVSEMLTIVQELKDSRKELEGSEKKLKKLNKGISKIGKEIDKIDKEIDKIGPIETKKSELETAKEDAKTKNDDFKDKKDKETEVDKEYKTKNDSLNGLKNKYNSLEELIKKYEDIKSKKGIKADDKKLTTAEDKLKKYLQSEINVGELDKDVLKQAEEENKKLDKEIKDAIKDFEKTNKELISKKKDMELAEKEKIEADKKVKELEDSIKKFDDLKKEKQTKEEDKKKVEVIELTETTKRNTLQTEVQKNEDSFAR